MKILIDAHMIGTGEGGNERYVSSLIKALGKKIKVDVIVGRNVKKLAGANHLFQIPYSNLLRYFFYIPKIVHDGVYDLVLSTYFISPLIASKNVITVHDLLPLHHPEYFSLRERIQFLFLSYSIRKARAIIVPTKYIADEMKHFFPSVADKLYVIPDAADPVFKHLDSKKRKILRAQNNIKNFSVLVFASRYAKRPLIPVIEGLRQINKPLTVFVLQAPIDQRINVGKGMDIRFLDNLSDNDLNNIYNMVDVVVYPSRYEGFGLPVVESLQSGVAVVANKAPTILEVAGSSISYFKIDNPSTLANVIRNLMKDSAKRKKFVSLGYRKGKEYSWANTAKMTIIAWKNILEVA